MTILVLTKGCVFYLDHVCLSVAVVVRVGNEMVILLLVCLRAGMYKCIMLVIYKKNIHPNLPLFNVFATLLVY